MGDFLYSLGPYRSKGIGGGAGLIIFISIIPFSDSTILRVMIEFSFASVSEIGSVGIQIDDDDKCAPVQMWILY